LAIRKILFYHEVAQRWTGLPFAVSEEEATQLAEATVELAAHYKIDLKELGVWGAWINFVGAAGIIYVPRLALVKAYREQMRQRARENAATPVYPVPPGAASSVNPGSFAEAAAAATNGAAAPPPPEQAAPAQDPMAVEGLQRAS
jgi:hypothetical protein